MKFLIVTIFFVSAAIQASHGGDTSIDMESAVKGLYTMLGLTIDYIFERTANCSTDAAELITFYAYKPGSTDYNQIKIGDADVSNVIDLSAPCILEIHGFIDSFFGGFVMPKNLWMQDMAKALTQTQNANVVAVDWKRLANYDYVIASQVNVPCVADYVTQFVQYLVDFGVNVKDIKIIGHSLGAQIAGGVGARLNGELDTIFGLDPAGPLFTYPFIVNIDKRLDPTDAQWVQSMHTACGSFGEQISSGHADFYLNGGANQPGCFPSMSTSYVCSHLKACDYFTSSITSPIQGDRCDSLKAFCNPIVSGLISFSSLFNVSPKSIQFCSNPVTDFIGMQTQKVPGTFNTFTNKNAPY